MQIIRNLDYVNAQKRRGRLLAGVGFAAFAVAFLLVFQRNLVGLILIAYALMFVGWFFFNMGMQLIGKYLSNDRKLRADLSLDKVLERLNDRYTLIHYAQLGKRVVEHLIVHSAGVLVVTVREIGGKITVDEQKWRRGGGVFGRFFNSSGPQLGNPSLDNGLDTEAVQEALREAGLTANVQGVIVFTNPLAEVSGSCPLDVLAVNELSDYVREVANDRELSLPGRDRLAIADALSQGITPEPPPTRTDRRKRTA